MEKMKQHEIRTTARQILGYLAAHGDAPVLSIKATLGKPGVLFYMGLGDLILRHRVALRERQGTFWAARRPESARAA